MKILLYLENKKSLANSGIGRAITHQTLALKSQGIDYTYDPKDTFDIAHLNSYQIRSYHLEKKFKKQGIPVIAHGHSTYEDFKQSFRCWRLMAPVYHFWLKRMYSHADLIITPTMYSKHLIENYVGVTCPVKAISNGIVLEDYVPNKDYVKEFETYFKIMPEEHVVVGVGFYFKRKGIDDFFEVARRMKDVKFIWFGYLQKILTTDYILQCIKNKPDNVLIPGYIKGNIIKGAYQRADCMLFPSHEETEGIVALEALASHLPLVIRDIGVYRDWLTDGVNCYKADDINGFIKDVRLCIEQPQSKLADEGYKTVQERSIDKVGKQLEEAYRELLETKQNKQ